MRAPLRRGFLLTWRSSLFFGDMQSLKIDAARYKAKFRFLRYSSTR